MYERILVAVAGGAEDTQLLEAAAAVAGPAAQVRVVHVRELDDPAAPVEQELTRDVARLRALGVDAEPEMYVAGHATRKFAALVAHAARRFHADLVLMGSRGLSDLSAAFRGSVSHEALARLEAPVLIVRGPKAGERVRSLMGGGRVLLAVDGPERATRLSGEIAALAPRARVHVVHVRRAVVAEAVSYVEPEDEASSAVNRFVRALRGRGLHADGGVLEPTRFVARAIAEAAQKADVDLVVMGSRRLGNLPALVLGSVSHEVVHLHDGPVLIVDRPASGIEGGRQAEPAVHR